MTHSRKIETLSFIIIFLINIKQCSYPSQSERISPIGRYFSRVFQSDWLITVIKECADNIATIEVLSKGNKLTHSRKIETLSFIIIFLINIKQCSYPSQSERISPIGRYFSRVFQSDWLITVIKECADNIATIEVLSKGNKNRKS